MFCEQGKNEVVLMDPRLTMRGGGDDDDDDGGEPESHSQISQQVLTVKVEMKRWGGDSCKKMKCPSP